MWMERKLYHWPNSNLFNILLALYLVVLVAWIIYEIYVWRKSQELNRLLSVAVPAMIFGISFNLGSSLLMVGFPLMIAHGFSYYGATFLALEKTQSPLFSTTPRRWMVAGVPIFMGTISFGLVYWIPSMAAVGVSIASWAFCCHQIFDTIIWKGNHHEAGKVYA